MSTDTTPHTETPSSDEDYSNANIVGSTITLSYPVDHNESLSKIVNATFQSENKSIPDIENRVPTAVIATLAGGGIGWTRICDVY